LSLPAKTIERRGGYGDCATTKKYERHPQVGSGWLTRAYNKGFESTKEGRPELKTRKTRNLFPPLSHEKLSSFKQRIGRGIGRVETLLDNGNSPENFAATAKTKQGQIPSMSRRQSLNIATRPPVSRQTKVTGVDASGTMRHISPVSAPSVPATVKSRPQYYDAKQNLDDEPPTPYLQYKETNTTEATLDSDKLAKELKRTQVDKAELQHALNKMEADKRSSEAGLNVRISALNEELKILRKELKEGDHIEYPEWKDALPTSQSVEQNQAYGRGKDIYEEGVKLEESNSNMRNQILKLQAELNEEEGRYANLAHSLAESERLGRDLTKSQKQKQLQNQDLENQLNLLREEHAVLKSENSELRPHLHSLEQDNQGLSRQLDTLKEQGRKLTNENERLRQQLNRLVQQAASQNTTVDPYHFDDPYFRKQFGVLRSSIKDWAIRAFSTSQSKVGRKQLVTVQKEFEAISKDWCTYMDSDEHRPAFVQAFVWDYLTLWVFGAKVWGPPATQPYGRLLEDYRPFSREYNTDSRHRGLFSLLIYR
jgi:hypothetical protein